MRKPRLEEISPLSRDTALHRQARPRTRMSDSRPRTAHHAGLLPLLRVLHKENFVLLNTFFAGPPLKSLIAADKEKHIFSKQGSWLRIRETLSRNWADETDFGEQRQDRGRWPVLSGQRTVRLGLGEREVVQRRGRAGEEAKHSRG